MGIGGVLGVVPARGGSKGLPRKNVRVVGGHPLFTWSVWQGLSSRWLDRVVVSTEDGEVAEVCERYGYEVVERPKELASDVARIEEVAIDAVRVVDGEWKYVVILQPTCPLREVSEIDRCVERCVKGDMASVSTIAQHNEHPMKSLHMLESGEIVPYFGAEYLNAPRQTLPRFYKQTGSVYVNRVADLVKAGGQRALIAPWQPLITKNKHIDIDDELDLEVVDFLLYRKGWSQSWQS